LTETIKDITKIKTWSFTRRGLNHIILCNQQPKRKA